MKKIIKNILFFIFWSFFFNAQILNAKTLPPGTGIADVPANILLMLDTSGSMGWSIGTTDAILKYPTGVDVDSSGNIYVLEYYSCRIKKFSSDGTFIKKAGGCGTRSGTTDMYLPEDIAICGNYIAIANTSGGTNYRGSIKIFDLDLNIVRERSFSVNDYYPFGVAWDANCEYIYYTVIPTSKILKIQASSLNHISTFGNGYGTGSGYMIYPIHLDLDSNGNIYVAEFWNHRVSKFNSSGTFVTSWGSYGSGNGNFRKPWGVAVDSSDNVFVSDLYNHRVQKFDVDGTYSTEFGSFGTGDGELYYPYGIGVDSDDQVYVTEWGTERVSRFTNTGTFVDTIGRDKRRIDIMIKAIKKILSDPDLVGKAHYGLLTWASSSSSRKLRVKIDKDGASKIPGMLDTIYPSGGTDLGSAMKMARKYFRGGLCCDPQTGKTYVSPQDPAAKDCQENIIIAISDGDWQYGRDPDPIAKDLLSSDKIKTYVLGYGGYTSSKSRYESLADAGGTDTPLYADNYDQLVKKLSDAIRQVYGNLNLTYTAPKFITETDSSGNELGDFVYQSTFEYIKTDQWKGKLAKKELDENGDLKKDSSGDTITIWDASTKLNAKAPADRNIWTIGFGLTSTDGEPDSYNNFTTANIANFYSHMFGGTTVTESEAEDHISFVRGYDIYDTNEDGSTTDTRWKLADIYNSQMAIVFPPNIPSDEKLEEVANTEAAYRKNNGYNGFKSQSLSNGGTVGARKKIVLVGSNAGMLHAFDVEDGEELWAFIPPALIYDLPKTMSDFTNQTNSISGVDGSPVVKDIYYDNGSGSEEWRTIALVGMGPGGKGYFALDITDTENPTHLFSFYNNVITRDVTFWNDDGEKYTYNYSQKPLSSVAPDYDYSNLGNSYSTPHILRMGIDGEDNWVAVFGGGYNIGSLEYASGIFVIDLEDGGINNEYRGGKLIKDVNLVDKKQKEREPSLNTDNKNEVIYIADGSNDEFEVTFRYDDISQVEVYVGTVDANEVFSGSITTGYTWKSKYYIQFNSSSIPVNDAAVKIKRNPAILNEEINNSVPARLTMLTADNVVKAIETATYKGAMIYVTDIEGNVWKVDMTGSTASFKKNILFDAEGDTLNQRYTFYDMAAAEFQEKIWLYFGTGNIQDVGLVDNDVQKIKIQNRIYGIKDKNFSGFIEIDDTTEKNLLTSQNYEQGSLTIKECSDGSPCPPKEDQLGWYTNMKDDSGVQTKNEKVTGKVLVTNKKVYVTRYQPQINKPCEAGIAFLSSHKYNCGSGVSGFAGTQSGVLELGVGIATGATQFKGNIYVGISGEEQKDVCQEGDPFCVQDNIVRITTTGSTDPNDPNAQQGGGATIEIDSWRELF